MIEDELQHLRVLIANERRERLELLAQVVAGLGHDVIAREIDVKEVGAATARGAAGRRPRRPGSRSEHALDLIKEIVREAFVPGDRPADRERPCVRPGSREAWGLCLHHRRRRPTNCRARSTSRCSDLRSTRACRAHSGGGL